MSVAGNEGPNNFFKSKIIPELMAQRSRDGENDRDI